jgi:hypothetical protein
MHTKYLLISIVVIIVIIFIWKWDRIDNFDVIADTNQLKLNLDQWVPPHSFRWAPWWYENNEMAYHQSVPSISNYDNNYYRFPPTNHIVKQEQINVPKYGQNRCANIPIQLQKNKLPASYKLEGFDPNGPTIQTIACGGCVTDPNVDMREVDVESYYDGSCAF